MNAQELLNYLTQDAGLDEATAKTIMGLASNPKVGERAAALKQQSEYDAIARAKAELEADLNGGPDKPGAKAYREWYGKNAAQIQKLQTDVARYEERYGKLDDPASGGGNPPTTTAGGVSKDDVQKLIHETIQSTYAARWGQLIKGSGTVMEKHMRAGRKDPIDWKALESLAEQKYNGDIQLAYDEWDRPAADAAAKESTEKEIERRVQEKLKQERSKQFFPAGADASPSSAPSPLSRDAGDRKFDRNALIQTAISGEYEVVNS